jgi:hypothetical protein
MDVSPTRFSLWTSDGGYSAYDSIIQDLDKEILSALRWIEEDSSGLDYLAAHLHALVTLGEGTGGYATTKLDIADLEHQTMTVFRKHLAEYPDIAPERIIDETAFLESLFLRLRNLV